MRRRTFTNEATITAHHQEKGEVRQISTGNLERVKGLRKEIAEARRGQHDGQDGRPKPGVPGDENYRQFENRQFHVAEAVALHCQREPKRNSDANNREAISQDWCEAPLQLWVTALHGSPRSDTCEPSAPERL